MTISAVLIVKNEEKLLENCLRSIKGIDELVLCDTGSEDRTVEIAKKYVKEVYFYKWDDSFCRARNYAKSKAKSSWVISLDADEVLHDYGAVREAVAIAELKGSLAVDVTMIASDNHQEFLYPRLFKNDPRVWWEGNIHNHLSVPGEGLSNVRITHGYSPAHSGDPDRAYRILKHEVETRPDAVREMFYLGREYFYRHDYENAVIMLGRYVQKSAYLPEKAEAFLIMARSYWNMSMANDARDAIAQALIINAHFKEALIFMSVIAGRGTGNETWEANAAQWERLAQTADNRNVLFVRSVFDFR